MTPTLLTALDEYRHGVSLAIDGLDYEAHAEGPRGLTIYADEPIEALVKMASVIARRPVLASPEEIKLLSRLQITGEPLWFYVAADEDPQAWDVGRNSLFPGGTLIEAICDYADAQDRGES